ncbi:MAG: tetratricopeptide repeat protein [Gammaproteobacteria bacterium]|nr:tetratricopeptide repeat protein [Gammaproteobacteria bacterium]
MSHYDDEAQVQELKRWWQENWRPLAAGIVLGLAGIFGWEAWQSHRTRVSEQASQMYEDLKKAVAAGKDDQVRALGDRLLEEFAATPYGAQAALLLAHRAAEKGDWESASRRLAWVVKHADDDGLKALARLRRARVVWAQGKPDEALELLDAKRAGEFAGLYEELRGDIRLAQGDRGAARAAYEKALELGVGEAGREQLRRKLDDLADAAPDAVGNG